MDISCILTSYNRPRMIRDALNVAGDPSCNVGGLATKGCVPGTVARGVAW